MIFACEEDREMFERAMRERDALRAKLEHAEKERANWEAVAEHRFQELEALQAKLDLAERVAADITEALNQLHVKLDQAKLKSADRVEWQAVAMKVSNERDALLAKLDASERACAEMRQVLRSLPGASIGILRASIENALSSDAGRDYVPMEDVRALLDAFINPSSRGDEIIGELQQKYPNLFPE